MEIKLYHRPPWLFNYKIQKDPFSLHFRKHKKVSIFYDDKPVDTKGITTKIIDRVKETYNSDLGRKHISYEGGKSLFTGGSLPRNKLKFTVVLEVMSSNRRHLLVRQSFFHINPKKIADLDCGVFGWRGLRTSFLATQSGSSLNIGFLGKYFFFSFNMSTTQATKKTNMVVLESSDKQTFEVEETIALQSQTIKHLIEDGCADTKIPHANVTSHVLAKVIEYCKKHVDKEDDLKANDDELKKFDEQFCNADLDQNMLFYLMLAANYVDIESLLDLTFQTAASMMKGKTLDEIKKIFHIKNDYTKEEEEEVRRENSWAFE